ncbi:acyl-CoA dehydrogenase family protein [Peribacillus sp. SCS-155]|uniref:acyl-CoA dehydrogenase family protein n=1 Tax=Peribacillus sedimenti TaxID=3115297 RepID=UPI0039064123
MKEHQIVEELIASELKPLVKKIDLDAYYPEDFMLQLGKSGLLNSSGLTEAEVLTREVKLVEEISKACMTTGFNLWCHLASLTYIRKSSNAYLKKEILPLLENGGLLGATGLSNPMKYYAGLETLHLSAKQCDGGYVVSGTLPSVSNLGPDHWFGFIASVDEHTRIMGLVPCDAKGLTLKEKVDYLGLNGSGTYSCSFDEVFIPEQWIVSQDADQYVQEIRPAFLIYQVPLGLGVTESSISAMDKVCNRQGGCNQYLLVQPDQLKEKLEPIREKTYQIAAAESIKEHTEELMRLRLNIAYLTLEAVQANMLHQGGSGYLQKSESSRRLREAYFLANLTPTIKHLEKMLQK